MLVSVVWIFVAALLGLGIGATVCFVVVRHYDHVNLTSASNRATSLVSQAQKEAENVRKEVELQAKDELYKGREELNREIEKARQEQRETERRLTKREDNLDKEQQELQQPGPAGGVLSVGDDQIDLVVFDNSGESATYKCHPGRSDDVSKKQDPHHQVRSATGRPGSRESRGAR